jgi:hypothetical protein
MLRIYGKPQKCGLWSLVKKFTPGNYKCENSIQEKKGIIESSISHDLVITPADLQQ